MRKILVFVAALVFVVIGVAEAQLYKVISWDDFWTGTKLIEWTDGTWEFTHDRRPIYMHTYVKVPAGATSISHLYRAATDMYTRTYVADMKETSGSLRLHGVSPVIKIRYVCSDQPDDSKCIGMFKTALEVGFTAQSLGVERGPYEVTGKMPKVPVVLLLVVIRSPQ